MESHEVQLRIPDEVKRFLRDTIRQADGNEVYFLGRVAWSGDRRLASLKEVNAFARGNRVSVPAIIERAEDWDVAIHNHPGGNLEPSQADVGVAGELGNRSVGFVIISNDAERHYVVVAPFPRLENTSIDLEEVRGLFAIDGPLGAALDGYEMREGQLEMALEVTRSLNNDKVLACEAGTGVGKSFAYLVPSVLWAVRNRRRVVVSTGTIHLQEQLVRKDLPFLEKVLPVEFRYALIKGRNNYACRRKLSELPHDFEVAPTAPDDQRQLEDLIEWARTSRDGSRADLGWTPPPPVWERVMSETDKSLRIKCPFYQDCFFYEAKRNAFKAHIVVANHHLYFADLSVRCQSGDYQMDLILPGYDRVIFDEAHHLEDVASEHLGVRFSHLGIRMRLGRMSSRDGKKGALTLILQKLRGWSDPTAADALERKYGRALRDTGAEIDRHFGALVEMLDGAERRRAGAENETRSTVRFKENDLEERGLWDATRERLEAVRSELERLVSINDEALKSLDRSRIADEHKPGLMLELDAFGGRIGALIGDINRFCDFADASHARWVNTQDRSDLGGRVSVGFATAPIRVSEALRDFLFEPLKSVVLTSATLSVGTKADYISERLGLDALAEERFRFRAHESPFRFDEQVLLAVPSDLAAPGSAAFEAALPGALSELLRAAGGRAFVLFTSYLLLRRMYDRLEGPLADLGFRPLAQGQAQRSELLERFRSGENCVLFGTDSFWEGVDVKGEALSCVILTRLPFRVPSEPLQEARLEEIQRRGGNAFATFTVPQAVLRFKQGFGRLIRSRSDRGVVAVLDSRVLSRSYGRIFLKSLPRTRVSIAPLKEVAASVEEFFREPLVKAGDA